MQRRPFSAGLWNVASAAALILCWLAALQADDRPKAKSKGHSGPPPHVPLRRQTIAKIDRSTREQAMNAAAKIDVLVEANYAKFHLSPNPLATDSQFVRRIYLDITGTIPTLNQVELFLSNKDPQKRSKLIDTLLSQEGYSSNFFNYWADILRLKDGALSNNVPGRPYSEWVKECLETNKPYDKFVYEMLTAEGKIWANPATGYVLRDAGMPLDAMNNTVRIFLGTQIGCAQCHNHPFEHWTQREFYEMAAFTFGTSTRRSPNDKMFGGGNVVAKFKDELKSLDSKFEGGGKYNRLLVGNLIDVRENRGKLTLPHDYRYEDGHPGDAITPKVIFPPSVAFEKGESPRVAFAKWVTSPENPRFAKTIANRLWKKSFGIGQLEPVDDLKDDSQPENPELMEFLTAEMIRLQFDLKAYLRVIYNTQVYQREATHQEVIPGDSYHFPGPVLRRMTAEQVWDSFMTMAAYNPDQYQKEPASVEAKWLNVDLTKATAQEIFQNDQHLRSDDLKKMRVERDRNHTYKGVLLVRAAELPNPRPPGHFLRQFGQSDRDSIESSNVDGAVPQVLQMFNGPITHMLLEPKSMMYKSVTSLKSLDSRVDAIFLAILARRPSVAERQVANGEIKAHGEAGFGNVIWALVNTREFLFIQ